MTKIARSNRDFQLERDGDKTILRYRTASVARSFLGMLPLVVLGISLFLSILLFTIAILDDGRRDVVGQMRLMSLVGIAVSGAGLYLVRRWLSAKTAGHITVTATGIQKGDTLYAAQDIEGLGWDAGTNWAGYLYRVYLEFGNRRVYLISGLNEA